MNILVSGSSSGIGRYLAGRLLASGHSIWGFSRSGGGDVPHARFHARSCDVADWDEVSRLASSIAAEPGFVGFDALVHCAAVQGPAGPAMTVAPLAWSNTVRANLDGTYFVIRAFFPLLRRDDETRRKILCFSGGGASAARVNFSAYGSSKSGVVRLVETLAEEFGDAAVDINAIAPGALPTQMTEDVIRAGGEAAGAEEVAAARRTLAEGQERFARLGALIDFLLGPDSDGITGRLLSAPWDPWERLPQYKEQLRSSDIYKLRRVTPADRGEKWD
ncbi:SDR family NAD(P)-dependent oxidoreductase [soil metagenome]